MPKPYSTFVVANRTMHSVVKNKDTRALEEREPSAGGLVTATKNIPMTSVVGWPGDNFGDDPISVQEDVAKRLARKNTRPVHLTEFEHEGHYLNLANQTFWPGFHAQSPAMAAIFATKAGWIEDEAQTVIAFGERYHAATGKKPIQDFTAFWAPRDQVLKSADISRIVIDRFVDTELDELVKNIHLPNPIVWVHDYQLMFFCDRLRERIQHHVLLQKKYIPIGFFCHIPFAPPAKWKDMLAQGFREEDLRETLLGPLGADQIGFHTQKYCDNFLNALIEFNTLLGGPDIISVNKNAGTVKYKGRTISIQPFPIGIEYATYTAPAEAQQRGMTPSRPVFTKTQQQHLEEFKNFHQGTTVILSVERLDPIKGIVEKLKAFQKLLELHPKLIDKISYECIVVPSRNGARINDELDVEIRELVHEINSNQNYNQGKFKDGPVHFVDASRDTPVLCEYYRLSHVINTASRVDGMNLTAMEYIAAREQGTGGKLILSPLMGVTDHFNAHGGADHYLIADPDGNMQDYAQILYVAVTTCNTPAAEKSVQVLKTIVVNHCNVHTWADSFLEATEQRALSNESMRLPYAVPASSHVYSPATPRYYSYSWPHVVWYAGPPHFHNNNINYSSNNSSNSSRVSSTSTSPMIAPKKAFLSVPKALSPRGTRDVNHVSPETANNHTSLEVASTSTTNTANTTPAVGAMSYPPLDLTPPLRANSNPYPIRNNSTPTQVVTGAHSAINIPTSGRTYSLRSQSSPMNHSYPAHLTAAVVTHFNATNTPASLMAFSYQALAASTMEATHAPGAVHLPQTSTTAGNIEGAQHTNTIAQPDPKSKTPSPGQSQ